MATLTLGSNYSTGYKGASIVSSLATNSEDSHPWDAGTGTPRTRLNRESTETSIFLLRFDLSSVPAGAIINSANLKVRILIGDVATNWVVSVRRLKTNWGVTDTDAGPMERPGTANQASWNKAFCTGTAWGGGGAFAIGTDAEAAEDTPYTFATIVANDWHTIPCTTCIANTLTAAYNYGFCLYPDAQITSLYCHFYHDYKNEKSQIASAPYLEIDYSTINPNTWMGVDF